MKRFASLHIIVLIVLLLQQQSGVSAFTSVSGVSNRGLARYSSTPPGRSRNIHHRINNINHYSLSSPTSLSAAAAPIQSISAASISTFYKASPLIAGFSIGLLCRLIQYTQDVNNNNSTNIKRRFSLRRRGSNYALVLCLGLVLGLVFEVLMHASGAAVPTILSSMTNV